MSRTLDDRNFISKADTILRFWEIIFRGKEAFEVDFSQGAPFGSVSLPYILNH
jgi:hypothetical protein